MGRKKRPADQPEQGRIEIAAPPDWIVELDRVAAAMGMSRSAYIRVACNMKMIEDRKTLGLSEPPQPEEKTE